MPPLLDWQKPPKHIVSVLVPPTQEVSCVIVVGCVETSWCIHNIGIVTDLDLIELAVV